MREPEDWKELEQWSAVLTSPSATPGALFSACEALYRLFQRISGLDVVDTDPPENRRLAQGHALAPVWAARCLLDFQRTHVFLRGLLAAIRAAQLRFPDRPMHVLYAGCGPFASLAIPLIPLLEPHSVVFTLLDIFPENLAGVEKIVAAFQLEPWIRDLVLADATNYQVYPGQSIHVLVGEMMQVGLQKEPQVAAMTNLAPQLVPGGWMVPQCITVQAGLLHRQRNMERMLNLEKPPEDVFRLLHPAFHFSQQSIAKKKGALIFPEMEIAIPTILPPGFDQLSLFTRIQVFENKWLEPWDSGLTQALPLYRLNGELSVRKIGLQYQTGTTPGFSWRVIH